MEQIKIAQELLKVARQVMAGVSVSIGGFSPRNMWWIMSELNTVLARKYGHTITADLDGGTDVEAFKGVINFYLPADFTDMAEVANEVARLMNGIGNGIRGQVKTDRSKMYAVPVIRVVVTANPDEKFSAIRTSSMTYTTWGRILEGLGLNAKYDVKNDEMPSSEYVRAYLANIQSMNSDLVIFARQILKMATAADRHGYKTIVWG